MKEAVHAAVALSKHLNGGGVQGQPCPSPPGPGPAGRQRPRTCPPASRVGLRSPLPRGGCARVRSGCLQDARGRAAAAQRSAGCRGERRPARGPALPPSCGVRREEGAGEPRRRPGRARLGTGLPGWPCCSASQVFSSFFPCCPAGLESARGGVSPRGPTGHGALSRAPFPWKMDEEQPRPSCEWHLAVTAGCRWLVPCRSGAKTH